MIDLNADILLTDGSTLKAENLKTDLEIADLSMKPQMVRRRKVTKENEYQILEFENGAKFFCLVYLSFLTREADITAENLRKGDNEADDFSGFDGLFHAAGVVCLHADDFDARSDLFDERGNACSVLDRKSVV